MTLNWISEDILWTKQIHVQTVTLIYTHLYTALFFYCRGLTLKGLKASARDQNEKEAVWQ